MDDLPIPRCPQQNFEMFDFLQIRVTSLSVLTFIRKFLRKGFALLYRTSYKQKIIR
jgi:hypothetical protein